MTTLLTRLENPRNHDGFTLIEVLVTTLIVGILAVIGFPPVLSNGAAAGHDDSVRASLPQYEVAMAEYRVVHGLSSASIHATEFKAVKHSEGNHFAVVSKNGAAGYCVLGYSESGEHNSPASALVITELDTSGTASCPLTDDPSTLDWN